MLFFQGDCPWYNSYVISVKYPDVMAVLLKSHDTRTVVTIAHDHIRPSLENTGLAIFVVMSFNVRI